MSLLMKRFVILVALTLGPVLLAQAQGVMPSAEQADALAGLRGKITGRIVWESNRNGVWQLFTMNADGTGAQRLTSPEADCAQARISADGARILFTRTPRGAAPQAWIMNADGTQARLLVDNAEEAAWRRGGQAIQFLRRPDPTVERWQTWEYDLAARQEKLLFPRPGVQYQPQVWSGLGNDDGTRFVIWSPNPRGTWVVAADGSVQKHVHGGCEGQVAADQEHAYGVQDPGRLVRFNLTDGEDLRPMLELSGEWSHTYFPRVSADGNWLAYGACPPDEHNHDTSDYELFIVRLANWKATGDPVRLTFNTRTDRWPDIWLAPTGDPNPLAAGPYDDATNRATTPPPPPRMLWSFAWDGDKPEFGGDFGLWPDNVNCNGTATIVPREDAEGGWGGAMRITYTIMGPPHSFSMYFTASVGNADLSAYDRFVLYARGNVPSLTIVVKDRNARNGDSPLGIAECVAKGLTDQWQRFEVPFADFRPRQAGERIDWRGIGHVGIAQIAPQSKDMGIFWVDNIRVETAPENRPGPLDREPR